MKNFSLCLRMCIFCCTFEHLPWLAHFSSHSAKANSLVATVAKCWTYSSSLVINCKKTVVPHHAPFQHLALKQAWASVE